ncbi:MAG: LysR family transcriptional regulator [Lachnospiraceae bacterium]|jgi:DNA-binding transcriptional LysR family regulator|nr:LysR family transcriptional regulator [Lachnospiraceae bacterium]
MYNRQLDTFLTAAETGSFSKAAAALYITPSAVIQQINNLEQDLKVHLFIRTKKGIILTRPGEYLYQEARTLIHTSENIRRKLTELEQAARSEIHVGTSLLNKCRLFYELWVRFSACHPEYHVKLFPLQRSTDFDNADLMEGIRYGSPWDKYTEFLELCQVPIACAVPRAHPLSSRRFLTPEDMKGQTLITLKSGISVILDRLQQEAAAHGVQIREVDWYNMSLFGTCILEGCLLQTPLCWQDIHPDLVTIPCQWEYALPYGLYYKKNPAPPVRDFLDFVQNLCETETMRFY